jgi:hypothetical protein
MNKRMLIIILSLWCINCTPAAQKPESMLKVCRFVVKKDRVTYVQYDIKKPAETIAVHEHKAKNGALSYSGVRKKGQHTASIKIKPAEAHKLFESFKKEHEVRQHAKS